MKRTSKYQAKRQTKAMLLTEVAALRRQALQLHAIDGKERSALEGVRAVLGDRLWPLDIPLTTALTMLKEAHDGAMAKVVELTIRNHLLLADIERMAGDIARQELGLPTSPGTDRIPYPPVADPRDSEASLRGGTRLYPARPKKG